MFEPVVLLLQQRFCCGSALTVCFCEGGTGEEVGVDHQVQAALQAAVGPRAEGAGSVQTGTAPAGSEVLPGSAQRLT